MWLSNPVASCRSPDYLTIDYSSLYVESCLRLQCRPLCQTSRLSGCLLSICHMRPRTLGVLPCDISSARVHFRISFAILLSCLRSILMYLSHTTCTIIMYPFILILGHITANIMIGLCACLSVLVISLDLQKPSRCRLGMTRVGPRNHILDEVEIPKGRSSFCRLSLSGPFKSISSRRYGLRCKWMDSFNTPGRLPTRRCHIKFSPPSCDATFRHNSSTICFNLSTFESHDGHNSLLRYLNAAEEIPSFVERRTTGTQRGSAQSETVRVQRQVSLTLQGI